MTTTVDLEDVALDVALSGPEDGTPVLLLHGFPQTSRSWAQVSEHLEPHGFRLVAPDQRGYSPGARPADVAAYTLPTLADDVVRLAAELGLDRFHLVGHDWGACVAWYLAAHRPDLVETLTAVSVPHLAAFGWALAEDADQQQMSRYMQLFRTEGKAEHVLLDDDARRLREMFADGPSADDVDAYVALLADGALTPALNWYRTMDRSFCELPAVRVPTTYVWSDADTALGRAGAERCGRYVDADYRFVVVPGVSHWVPDRAPRELADAIAARVLGTAS
ncbi:alpha/beta fold hydrolase [Solicola sp. PLA-1-18]|uniref:alpha/beta fold hydrolase n=1 Tax=Solicola sp. PLA-1-18 TaxID=3380532 RepID=UPI003B7F30FE